MYSFCFLRHIRVAASISSLLHVLYCRVKKNTTLSLCSLRILTSCCVFWPGCSYVWNISKLLLFLYLGWMRQRRWGIEKQNRKGLSVCEQRIWGTEAAMCEATALKSAWSNRFCLSGRTTQLALLAIWERFGVGCGFAQKSKSNTVYPHSLANKHIFLDQAPNEVNGEFSLWGRGGVTLLMLMFFVRRSRSLMLFSEDFSVIAAPVNTDETCCFPTHITMITYSLLDAQFPRRNRIC